MTRSVSSVILRYPSDVLREYSLSFDNKFTFNDSCKRLINRFFDKNDCIRFVYPCKFIAVLINFSEGNAKIELIIGRLYSRT
jgi:hypothetical protein